MSRRPSADDRSFSNTGTSDPSYPSAAYRRLLEQVERFARDDRATILLEGESGTGKTTLARHIHSRSRRASQPFQQVVLATIEDSLAASALFGHVDGAFTDARRSRPGHFASANGGTVFLDEIGKASLTVQHRLLHIVEYGSFHPVGADREVRVDVRIVAATNVSLAEQAAAERFLPDLLARLSSFRVHVPPLRERRADIPMLAMESLRAHSYRRGLPAPPRIHEDLLHALRLAPWPNNLRQLDAAMHRILVDADGAPELTLDHCEDDSLALRESANGRKLTPELIADAIERKGTKAGAARFLNVNRKTLYRNMKRSTDVRPPDSLNEGSGG
jgi:DNA-binding NtrC family response regulator